jgi:hypothetical protein
MKVKIRRDVYNAEIEPILVILSEEDKENIKNMEEDCFKYCVAPEELSEEDIREFMKL